ncbi:ferritin-like domain-containing protein [Fodinicola feengrottensis]|uniref:Ferritin-like domain-containing protein n=1 Tax=Fodinicola feengrottensis TaxID=435914 RepID=A0ABN2GJA1_9ACTN|nr:ferritin-like domain-containing protein [Fodinicola feengrottensis]
MRVIAQQFEKGPSVFGKRFVRDLISRSAENGPDRRKFLVAAGAAGLGLVGTGALATAIAPVANAATRPPAQKETVSSAAISDAAILNFALNLEYLEAEFYSYAVHGHGLADSLTTGTGARGGVTGGRAVPFLSRTVRQFAQEIAGDELAHVTFLRTALGSAAVSRPAIDIKNSFTAAARAAGLIGAHQTFDPYQNENNFLLAAFIFEDVGVTAYKGAAPLVSNKTYLEAAAGILAVEAYHAATIRSSLYQRDLCTAANKISNARDSLDGASDDDQGITLKGQANIVPTDSNGVAYSRSAGQVLNVVYLNPKKTTSGGFFPKGVNGAINTSAG